MKIFTALLGTETNTFSPFVTGFQNFEETYLVRGGNHSETPSAFAIPLIVWRDRAREQGWEVAESLAAFATPAGVTLRHVYESYRDEILADLLAAMPVDAVFLNMHGAMVAEGYDDCEGDLLARVREMVGPDVPVGVELDLHCHLTKLMVDKATAIITFKEYPHIDFAERAEELFSIIAGTLAGKVKPHMALYDCRMVGVFHTSREPMRGYVDDMQKLEGSNDVLSVSLAHCFPWGDVPEMGARTLVITDNRPEYGAQLAQSLGQKLFDLRTQLVPPYLSIDEALDRALAGEKGPVVLADVSDNSGGGAPNDSTFILRRLLERGIANAAIACIWDPVAVSLAIEAGAGAQFEMRIGGKMGPMSGDPVDLLVRVIKVTPEAVQTSGSGANRRTSRLGDAAGIEAHGIEIVINSKRTQTLSPTAFSNLGIDPSEKQILVVKSMQHFYAEFAPIAAEIFYVAAPGAMLPNFDELPYERVDRSLWPLSEGQHTAN
jgi:microcystin degradation protein MlrC